MDWDPSKTVSHPITAGLLGALAGLKFAPGVTFWEKLTYAITGFMCSVALSPAVSELLRLPAGNLQFGLAFVVGMFGMSIAAAVMQGIKDLKVGDIFNSYFSRNQSTKPKE